MRWLVGACDQFHTTELSDTVLDALYQHLDHDRRELHEAQAKSRFGWFVSRVSKHFATGNAVALSGAKIGEHFSPFTCTAVLRKRNCTSASGDVEVNLCGSLTSQHRWETGYEGTATVLAINSSTNFVSYVQPLECYYGTEEWAGLVRERWDPSNATYYLVLSPVCPWRPLGMPLSSMLQRQARVHQGYMSRLDSKLPSPSRTRNKT